MKLENFLKEFVGDINVLSKKVLLWVTVEFSVMTKMIANLLSMNPKPKWFGLSLKHIQQVTTVHGKLKICFLIKVIVVETELASITTQFPV